MFKSTLFVFLLFSFCFSTFVHAQNQQVKTFVVQGQKLLLSDVRFFRGLLDSAELAYDSNIQFGENILTAVPKGTSFSFAQNSEGQTYIKLMAVGRAFQDQKWITPYGDLIMNCSPYLKNGSSTLERVVTFYENLQMNGRCKSVKPLTMNTPDGGFVRLDSGSEVFLTKSGMLKSASVVKWGHIFVQGKRVELEEGKTLSYYDNEALHYFSAKAGEFFTAPTSFSTKTLFKQIESEQVRPFVFYPNGAIDSGRVLLSKPVKIQVSILGKPYDFEIKEGHVGFDEQGRVDRFLNQTSRDVYFSEDIVVYLINGKDRTVTEDVVRAGLAINIFKYAHLFLTYKDGGKASLSGFPVMGRGVKYFFSFQQP